MHQLQCIPFKLTMMDFIPNWSINDRGNIYHYWKYRNDIWKNWWCARDLVQFNLHSPKPLPWLIELAQQWRCVSVWSGACQMAKYEGMNASSIGESIENYDIFAGISDMTSWHLYPGQDLWWPWWLSQGINVTGFGDLSLGIEYEPEGSWAYLQLWDKWYLAGMRPRNNWFSCDHALNWDVWYLNTGWGQKGILWR